MIEHLKKMSDLAKANEPLWQRGELKKVPTNKLIPHMIDEFVNSGRNLVTDSPIIVSAITRELGKRRQGLSDPKGLQRTISAKVAEIADRYYPHHKEQAKAAAANKENPKAVSAQGSSPGSELDKLKSAFVSGSSDFHSTLANLERQHKAEHLAKLVESGKFEEAKRLFDEMHGSKQPESSPRYSVPVDRNKAHEVGFEQKQEKIVNLPDQAIIPEKTSKETATSFRDAKNQAQRKEPDQSSEFDQLWNDYSKDPDYEHLKDYHEPHHLPLMQYELKQEFPGSDDEYIHSLSNHFIRKNKERIDKQDTMNFTSQPKTSSPSLGTLKEKKQKLTDSSVSWAPEPEMPKSPPASSPKPSKNKGMFRRK